jgi:hypothetical protein
MSKEWMLAKRLGDSEEWALAWSNPDPVTVGLFNQLILCEVFGWEDGSGYDQTIGLTLLRNGRS